MLKPYAVIEELYRTHEITRQVEYMGRANWKNSATKRYFSKGTLGFASVNCVPCVASIVFDITTKWRKILKICKENILQLACGKVLFIDGC